MEFQWLDTGQYWVDVDNIRTAIMKNAMNADTEAQTAEAFQTQLYYYIRLNTGVELKFNQETPIKGGLIHNFGVLKNRKSGRGRIDAIVNDLIIEYKNSSKFKTKTEQETAINQVKDYLNTLKNTKAKEYNAILTDGIKIIYFCFEGNEIQSTAIKTLGNEDIDRIIRAILDNDCKKFVAENIYNDFIVSKDIDSLSKDLAIKLYHLLCNNPTDKTLMLFCEWESLTHLSYDDNGKSSVINVRRKDLSLIFNDDINSSEKEYKALFALQTTYAVIVKLIACKVINILDYGTETRNYSDLTKITPSDLQKFLESLEDGYVYTSSNIINLLEGDFFSWYSTHEQWDADLWRIIIKIISRIDDYSTFSFNITYTPVDIFKDLYMGIIPKSVRHSMGEYFTPGWLADYVIKKGLSMQPNQRWKALDPCCGSGTFIIQLIKNVVGDVDLYKLTDKEKEEIKNRVLESVYGIDINPLSVLSARVGYYLALRPFGNIKNIEIPIYLGDSAITPQKILIDGIVCYSYSVNNKMKSFDIVLPVHFVESDNFGMTMYSIQAAVKTNNETIVFEMIKGQLSEEEKKSSVLMESIEKLSADLVELHKKNWDGIWIRIATNFMLIARLSRFDLIVGNPPWVKWEHLPSEYAKKIKELCNVKHIFSTRGRTGGTQLNICALISNVSATNWLKDDGVLAFLMPDSIMSQNSYEEFRYFYIDYEKKVRLYLQCIDKWEKPLCPFTCDDYKVTQDFNTYYYSRKESDYSKGIDVTTITRSSDLTDAELNKLMSYDEVESNLVFDSKKAAQLSKGSSVFSYLSGKYDISKIVGQSSYEYRTGVEFTPQELYMLVPFKPSTSNNYYVFKNKKFTRSTYIVDDMPVDGWDLPTQYIYPIVTGPSLSPFKCNSNGEYCILPYNEKQTNKPISISELMRTNFDLFTYLLNHQELISQQSKKSIEMHRGEEFYALSKIGPYTFAPYIVAARDNTKFCSCVIKREKTAWDETKQSICVKHTILISRDITGRFITEDEAYFISGILNSSVIIEYMHNTFKSNGFSLKKSNVYLPMYNKTVDTHKSIVSLSKEGHVSTDPTRITNIQEELSDLYLLLCETK